MKKLLWLLPILFLCGCAAQPAMETVSDVYAVPASVAGYTLSLQLPEAAAQFTMEEPGGSKLFQCQGYTVTVQELESGDLARTVRAVTGQDMEHLTVLTTRQGEFRRHAFAWTNASVPPKQRDFLRDVLAMPETEEAYVFVHQNLDPTVESHHIIRGAEEIRAILRESGKVKAVFQGHYHPGKESVIDGIPYHTLPAMCEGEENRYMITEI